MGHLLSVTCLLDNKCNYVIITSDTLTIDYDMDGNWQPVGLVKTDIAWTTDRRSKYGNPSGFDTNMRAGNTDKFH